MLQQDKLKYDLARNMQHEASLRAEIQCNLVIMKDATQLASERQRMRDSSARHGEHGRGFDLVASEVRALAQKSAQAAHEIKGVVHQSIEKTTSGNALVTETVKAFQAIEARCVKPIMPLSVLCWEQVSSVMAWN